MTDDEEEVPTRSITLPQAKSDKRVVLGATLGWVVTIGLALALTFGINAWVLQVYSIPSESMIPTLLVGDRVVVSKLSTDPGRGDIVVFERPANDPAGPGDPEVLIKRVIGLPGETVTAQAGVVYINGSPLQEDYLPEGVVTLITGEIKVGDNQLLMLGDNRTNSKDGRVFGPIDKSLVVGRAIFRIWPFSRAGGL